MRSGIIPIEDSKDPFLCLSKHIEMWLCSRVVATILLFDRLWLPFCYILVKGNGVWTEALLSNNGRKILKFVVSRDSETWV